MIKENTVAEMQGPSNSMRVPCLMIQHMTSYAGTDAELPDTISVELVDDSSKQKVKT